MLPRTHLFAILSFLVEMTLTSPVYNMQPTFITATIGSTGRNIRNLPCISRKNNQSGVCMFAIDCLKANGTHLGTCIDRFYFGSCCHIEPLQDITENTIDVALIPSREPPLRIASTTTKTVDVSTEKIVTISTTASPTSTLAVTNVTQAETTTISVTPTQEDIESFKITTFQTVEDVKIASPTTPATTTIKTTSAQTTTPSPRPKPIKTKPTYKPTASSIGTKVTTKVTKPRPQTTPKPKPVQSSSTFSTGTHPTRLNATVTRPRPKPTKPVRITKPISTSAKPNVTLGVQTTTQRVTTSTTKLTKKPSIIITKGTTTRRPIITAPSKLPVNVSVTKTTTSTPTTTKLATTAATTPTTTLSNELHTNVNQTFNDKKPDLVNGNPATNEIESPTITPLTTTTANKLVESTTLGQSFVTWSEINKNNSVSNLNVSSSTASPTTTSASSGEDVTNPDDWVPITDGWVLLPSLTTTPEAETTTINSATTTSKSNEYSSVSSSSTISSVSSESTSSASSSVESTENISSTSTSSSSTEKTSEISTSTESASSSSEETSTTSSGEDVSTSTAAPLATSGINMSDFTDVCGRRMVPEGRIVGGEKSSFGKWPWQISLRQWRTSTYLHKCGAALLNENWAITAAHCVDNVPPSDLLLRLGEHDLSTESEPYLHQERRVQIVASHPQFDPRTFEYDLALLRFYEPVTFQPNIIPVCVPQTDENFVGRNAHVTGWGRLYEDGPLPSVLQEVSVPVINNTVCESMYRSAGYIEHIPNIFICAGWRRGGFDSCEGDSGGPMVIQRSDKRFLLAGVISWGIGCAEPNQPGVYTRISEFRDWINQILQF